MAARSTTAASRTGSRLLLIPLLATACAAPARQTAAGSTRAEPEPPRSTGWVSIDAPRSRETEAAYRIELSDRRRELLDRCDDVLGDLETRRRAIGSVPLQLATGLLTQSLAGAASTAQSAVTGAPTQLPLPTGSAMGATEAIRLDREIRAIRDGRRLLVEAETNAAILEAMDRLRPHCSVRH